MDMNIDYEANETIFHSRPILQAAHWGWGGGSSGRGKQEKTEMALPFLNTSRVIQELQISSLLLGLLFVAKLLITLAFNPVEEILWCYHSNETFSAILSHGTIYLVCSANF